MNKLITLLLNFYFKVKDLHYKALNEGRLGDHAFLDTITDGVMGDIDDIQEVVNGIKGDFAKTEDIIEKVDGNCYDILLRITDLLEDIVENKGQTDGTINLMNSLSQKYQHFYSFLRKYKE